MDSDVRLSASTSVNEGLIDRVEAAAEHLDAYFAKVRPTPFLHDITTKNVIMDGKQLSAIVDVDDLCFGDPLFLIGLIRMALLANGHAVDYADSWVSALNPDKEHIAALDFYTALFSVDFMAELGRRFNRTKAAPVSRAYVERLEGLVDRYLARLGSWRRAELFLPM